MATARTEAVRNVSSYEYLNVKIVLALWFRHYFETDTPIAHNAIKYNTI